MIHFPGIVPTDTARFDRRRYSGVRIFPMHGERFRDGGLLPEGAP